MVINIKNKEVELKFTFNSFKYMEEFDVTELQEIDKKPFKILSTLETLLYGACNNNPKFKVSVGDVGVFLEEYIAENDVVELLEELMNQLEKSDFFKSLQKKK